MSISFAKENRMAVIFYDSEGNEVEYDALTLISKVSVGSDAGMTWIDDLGNYIKPARAVMVTATIPYNVVVDANGINELVLQLDEYVSATCKALLAKDLPSNLGGTLPATVTQEVANASNQPARKSPATPANTNYAWFKDPQDFAPGEAYRKQKQWWVEEVKGMRWVDDGDDKGHIEYKYSDRNYTRSIYWSHPGYPAGDTLAAIQKMDKFVKPNPALYVVCGHTGRTYTNKEGVEVLAAEVLLITPDKEMALPPSGAASGEDEEQVNIPF